MVWNVICLVQLSRLLSDYMSLDPVAYYKLYRDRFQKSWIYSKNEWSNMNFMDRYSKCRKYWWWSEPVKGILRMVQAFTDTRNSTFILNINLILLSVTDNNCSNSDKDISSCGFWRWSQLHSGTAAWRHKRLQDN